jgi:predicted CoA-substrate-specific enzyme activase
MAGGQTAVGLDIGSTTVKGVVLAPDGDLVRAAVLDASGDYARDIEQIYGELANGGAAQIIATGYGQDLVAGTINREVRTLSEIGCHARGVHWMAPATQLVIDVGGQDLKVIALGPRGIPQNFKMNDKCAAGTGRFLDVMARALGVPVSGLADLAARAERTLKVSSMCTVFAESEVITLLARGESRASIANGLLDSIAERIFSMVQRVGAAETVAMTGGGALNRGVVAAVGRRLKCEITVPAHPQLAGALGAALTALPALSRTDRPAQGQAEQHVANSDQQGENPRPLEVECVNEHAGRHGDNH